MAVTASPTPTLAASAATQTDLLPLNGTTLIGTFAGPGGVSALLRMRGGDIKRVAPGDRVGRNMQVAAIEDGIVRLSRGGKIETLGMPRS